MEKSSNLYPIEEFVRLNGKVEKISYFEFVDGIFSFWEAKINDRQSVVFRVRIDINPEKRAFLKGLPSGVPLSPAKSVDVEKWLKSHPKYPILRAISSAG